MVQGENVLGALLRDLSVALLGFLDGQSDRITGIEVPSHN